MLTLSQQIEADTAKLKEHISTVISQLSHSGVDAKGYSLYRMYFQRVLPLSSKILDKYEHTLPSQRFSELESSYTVIIEQGVAEIENNLQRK